MKKQIGIISDTHDLLRPEVVSALQGCDAIFHCGDICREEILDTLARIAPIWAVRGNNDFSWAERLKIRESVSMPDTAIVDKGE